MADLEDLEVEERALSKLDKMDLLLSVAGRFIAYYILQYFANRWLSCVLINIQNSSLCKYWRHTAIQFPQMTRPQQSKRRSRALGFSLFESY